jgi:hypothetical protein
MRYLSTFLALACTTFQVLHVSADEPAVAAKAAAPETTPIVSLTLHPTKETVPALRYVLLPPLLERTPGNAAVVYNKLDSEMSDESKRLLEEKARQWLDLPLADLPRKDVREHLARWQGKLDDLRMAARRESCDWELPLRERTFVAILLPELQSIRKYGFLLALQARLQVADGQFDKAVDTLQSGFSLARQLAEGETLIHGLVGAATFANMLKPLDDLIQQPNSPNLYWALTALPQPIIDLRKGLESEAEMLYLSYPDLRPAERDRLRPESFELSIRRMVRELTEAGVATVPTESGTKTSLTAQIVAGYPKARARLLERGRTVEQLDKMKQLETVAIDALELYDELRDRMFRNFYLPYWEADKRLAREEDLLRDEAKSQEIIPLASLLLPSLGKAHFAQAKTERSVAAHRVIEAIRLHAITNDGKLPTTLDEIKVVPIPIDPTTGKPFQYRREGALAKLISDGGRPEKPSMGVVYELRMTAPK